MGNFCGVGSQNHENKTHVCTMVWPALIDIKWASIMKINIHKHLKHKYFYYKNFPI